MSGCRDLADDSVEQPPLVGTGWPALGAPNGQRADRLAREDQGEPLAFAVVEAILGRRLADLDAGEVQAQRPADSPGHLREDVIGLGRVLQPAAEQHECGVRVVPGAVDQAGGPPAQHALQGKRDCNGDDKRGRLAEGVADYSARSRRDREVDGEHAHTQARVDKGLVKHPARVEEPVSVHSNPGRHGQGQDARQFGHEIVVAVSRNQDDHTAGPPRRRDEPPSWFGQSERAGQSGAGTGAP
jgi:hypothetical protein